MGDTVIFKCISNRKVSWYHNDEPYEDGSSVKVRYTDINFIRILISSLQNSGIYSCQSEKDLVIDYDYGELYIAGTMFNLFFGAKIAILYTNSQVMFLDNINNVN